jgi:hypothetical protein
MPKRLDEAEAVAIMKSADFLPLEPYKLIKDPWKCKCLKCGNIVHPILNNVKSGQRGCKTCGAKERGRKTSLRKRMPKEALDQILADKFVELLGDFTSTKKYLQFRCVLCKHEFSSKVAYIQNCEKFGCPQCRKTIPRRISTKPRVIEFDNVQEIVTALGFRTQTTLARNNDLIQITCTECQTTYKKKFVSLKESGFTCKCKKIASQAIRGVRYLELGRVYAKTRGGEMLTDSVHLKKDRVLWKCSNGHQWEQPLDTVLSKRSWCKDCAGQTPRTLDELRTVAESRGGKLLSSIYINVDATYDFQCSLGHEFSNSFKHVVGRGQWCPTCNKGSKSEEICRTTFEQLFGKQFKKVRPKWLRNSRGRQMEIDGYNHELRIGFEYQGIQHFSKQFFGTSLEQRILDDQLKAKLCEENGISLFIIDYRMEYQDFPEAIRAQAKHFGLDVSEYDFTLPVDITRAYIRDDRLPILKSLLKEKKITVLSTKWIGVKDKYEFRCEVCGHEWTATGSHFFNSRRVGGCQKCSIKLVAGANRLDLDEVHEFAKRHGGKCLSTEYGHIKQKYSFECSKGHKFDDIYNNMKFRNTFCPTCENRSTKNHLSDEEALAVLKKFNLEPIAPRPKLISTGWPAKCLVCGEEVGTSLQHLLDRGSPCKYCSGASISEAKTREVFSNALLEPIEPFKTGTAPWKSKCLTCGSIVNGRYSNLVKGQSGCRTCYYASKKDKK